ncbi:LOW QUALITY PROTEIN: hypothetical protein HID58_069192 [Brassica napus]|uniref:Uncharacterized protein n=1 Tax=Brassica napus TaxID=3708 RepID=A0ABQ7XF07_BRANA|nr:LOW QUALITY PROTEIN: hypothetical protein HID58_069192 [Brassica napus]
MHEYRLDETPTTNIHELQRRRLGGMSSGSGRRTIKRSTTLLKSLYLLHLVTRRKRKGPPPPTTLKTATSWTTFFYTWTVSCPNICMPELQTTIQRQHNQDDILFMQLPSLETPNPDLVDQSLNIPNQLDSSLVQEKKTADRNWASLDRLVAWQLNNGHHKCDRASFDEEEEDGDTMMQRWDLHWSMMIMSIFGVVSLNLLHPLRL